MVAEKSNFIMYEIFISQVVKFILDELLLLENVHWVENSTDCIPIMKCVSINCRWPPVMSPEKELYVYDGQCLYSFYTLFFHK